MAKKILRSLADLLPENLDFDPLSNDELLKFFFLSDPDGALRLYLDSVKRLVDQQTQFAIAEEWINGQRQAAWPVERQSSCPVGRE